MHGVTKVAALNTAGQIAQRFKEADSACAA
jgi:hypothetical protein